MSIRPVVLLVLLGLVRSALAAASSLQLTLPPAFYAVPGVPMSVYFDNVVLTEATEQYRFEVTCPIGTSEERRWTVTPTDAHVGRHVFTLVVRDAPGAELERARTLLHVAPREAGVGDSLRLLIVGDSLTNATHYPNELARLLSTPGNPRWTMLGTHRPASAAPGVAHEGYGGWTWKSFLSLYTPADEKTAAGPLARKRTSPFISVGADGKPNLDLARYVREACDNQPPDVVTFLLGINDCFSANPNDPAAMDKSIGAALENAENLLQAFRAACPQTIFAIGLTTPPNARESGFEANYKGKYHRWGWKRIQHRLVQRMLTQFSGREAQNIHVVPTELNLDPVDGYPENNGVHPNVTGYQQIGASFYAWLKWRAQSAGR
jgi:lysophospholipase L1-like esterase